MIRIALVGCGRVAVSAHLPALAELRSRVRLVATADVDLAAAERAARPWGASAYADAEAAVSRRDVDAVVIAVPEAAHCELTLLAAEEGKHVLVEKPIAPSLEEADVMIEAAQTAGVRLMAAHSRRFAPRYRALKEAVDDGRIGRVRLFRENERRIAARNGYWSVGHWSADPQLSGGVALSHGIHEMDLMRWVIGGQAIAVAAIGKRTSDAGHVYDSLSAVVTFSDGAIGATEIITCLPNTYPALHELEVYGETGRVLAKDHDMLGMWHYASGSVAHPMTTDAVGDAGDAFRLEHEAFLDAIEYERELPVSAEEARAALVLALAANESMATRRCVSLVTARE